MNSVATGKTALWPARATKWQARARLRVQLELSPTYPGAGGSGIGRGPALPTFASGRVLLRSFVEPSDPMPHRWPAKAEERPARASVRRAFRPTDTRFF
jgi:hypothetical protein